MEKQLFQNLLLPLKEIAFRRVIIHLWCNTLYSNWSSRYHLDFVENIVKDKLSKILPSSINKQMMHSVRPIGSKILNWQQCHENNFHDIRECFGLHSLKHLQWTSTGTIDYQKTMEKIIDLKLFDDEKRYELACLYCLEDYIPLLSEELSKNNENLSSEKFYLPADQQLIYYWTEMIDYKPIMIEGKEPSQLLKIQDGFKLAAVKGNIAATRYFFHKLSNERREKALFPFIYAVIHERCTSSSHRIYTDFPKENISEVICYLLSLMSPEQQMQVLKSNPCNILTIFQDWPLQDLFLEVAEVVWTFLPEEKYPYVLMNIHKKVKTSGYYCPKLFQEFFLQSPGNFKKYFVDKECCFGYFISEFFRKQDSETIEVIFRNVDATDRVKLIFSKQVLTFLYDSIFYDRLHMAKVILQEAMLPKEDWQRLKKNFLKFIKKTHKRLGGNEFARKQKSFSEFFDKTCTTNEEKSEDETPEVKKLCTEKNVPLRN